MTKTITVKKNPTIIVFIAIIAVSIAVVLALLLSKHSERVKHSGPLFKTAIGDPKHWTQSTMHPQDNSQVIIFGSTHFTNDTNSKINIVDIKPTNVPSGLIITQIGVLKNNSSVAGVGVLTYSQFLQGRSEKSITRPPIELPPNKDEYQMVVACSAPKDGIYTIQGLLITYQWNGDTYQDYFSNQIDLCTGKACPNIAPPPSHWP